MGWRLALGWSLLAFAVLLFAPAGDPLQIMAEHAPADGTGPVLKLARQTSRQCDFEDRHACFGAAAPRLHLSNRALRPSVVWACWIFWADHRADATLGEEGFVVLAVEAAVGHVAEFVGKIMARCVRHFHAFSRLRLELLFIQLVINDQSSPAFDEEIRCRTRLGCQLCGQSHRCPVRGH